MILKGIVEEVFGSATIFRGYATLKTLSTLSQPKSYQRTFDDSRLDELKKFMKDGTFKFFPELIFSLQLKDNDALFKIKNEPTTSSITLSNNIKIKKAKFAFTAAIGEDPVQKTMSIDFPEDLPNPINRLDGNHRLTVVDRVLNDSTMDIETLRLKDSIGNTIVPFSILLQTEEVTADKYETAFFHLINSKAKPLTDEETLKAILEGKLFADHEIAELVGENGSRIIELLNTGMQEHCSAISHITKDKYRSLCLDLVKLLDGDIYSIDEFMEAMKTVERLYYSSAKLKDNTNSAIFLSLVYFHITDKSEDKKKFVFFKDWVIDNDLFQIDKEGIKATSIIKIFDKISARRVYKLFVAMPYWSHTEVNEYNKLFKEICSDVSKKARVELELIPIMRFRGRSQRIDQRLLDKIQECDIFIADVTGNNINVVFEVGYADAHKKPIILFKNEMDPTHVPFDMDKMQYLPYPDRGYYNDIKMKAIGNIMEIIRNDFKVVI